MKIQIQKLTLVNFKGIKSLSIDFGEFTSISGANATGKSTIADAFTWLLFGKDTQDRKDFEVKTLDKNNVVIPRIDHEVTGDLLVDGVLVSLKRTLREKWVKKQGTNDTVFTGNETLYFVNDVPKSQKDYQDYINQIMPEATFKLLTNPAYFNSIKWQDRRAMLTAIANIPDDDTIAGSDLSTVLMKMRTERKTESDLKKEYAVKKTKIKAALEQIPARLDEISRNTPEAKDFDKIEREINSLKSQIKAVDSEINDKSKGVQEQAKVRSNTLRLKNELEMAISNIRLDAMKEFGRLSGAKDNEISSIKMDIKFNEGLIVDITDRIKRYEGQVSILTEANNKLRANYAVIAHQTFDENGIVDTCPSCKQRLPEGDIEAQRITLAANFNKDKAEKIAKINIEGTGNKAEIEKAKQKIDELKVEIESLKSENSAKLAKIDGIQNTPSNLQSVDKMLESNQDYINFSHQLSNITIPEIKEVDTSDLQMKKANLSNSLESLQAEMTQKGVIDTLNARKEELLREEETLNQELSQIEGFEFQVTEFTNRKMQAVEDAVNKLFPTVKFKMFEQQINGGIADTCQTLINGVPYSDANNAGRINAGLEIIGTFSKINDTHAPVFVDNAESANSLYPIESQLIALYVTEDKKLKVSVNEVLQVA